MNRSHQLRNIFIIEEKPCMHDVLHALLAGLGCECDIACNGLRATGMIGDGRINSILLDLRHSEIPAGEMVLPIKELRPHLLGRVLIITGEVWDPQIVAIVRKNSWTYISRHRATQELYERLHTVLGFSQRHCDRS